MSEPVIKETMEFIQTDRTGWVTKMNMREIIQLLPKRTVEQLPLFTETNRPISENHLRGIIKIWTKLPTGPCPALSSLRTLAASGTGLSGAPLRYNRGACASWTASTGCRLCPTSAPS